jgi:hypothetical protein
VLAAAFEVLRPVDRQVLEVQALASRRLALHLPVARLQEVVRLVGVVAEALIGGAYCFAVESFGVVPGCKEAVLGKLRVVPAVVVELFLAHHDAPVVAHQVAVLNVFVHVLCQAALTNLHLYTNHPQPTGAQPDSLGPAERWIEGYYSGWAAVAEGTAMNGRGGLGGVRLGGLYYANILTSQSL